MKTDLYKEVEAAINRKDIEAIKNYILDNEYEISGWGKVDLIIQMLKINRKECLKFIEQYIEGDVNALNLSYAQDVDILLATKSKECIEKFLEKNFKKINSEQKKYLIEATNDGVFMAKCVNSDELFLEMKDRKSIIENIIVMQDEEAVRTLIKLGIPDTTKKIEIPKKMTVGIEIEVDGIRIREDLVDGWIAKTERSLPDGTEIVSPVLKKHEEDCKNIYGICNLLKQAGGYTNQKCAAHVHIGADYLTTKKAYANFLELWCNSEELLYLISNPPGEVTRQEAYEDMAFASPISKKVKKAIETGDLYLSDEEDLENFVKQIKKTQGDARYYSVNFLNIEKKGKNTIEIRLSNGTIEPEIWIENINLFCGLIKALEDLAKIQVKEEKNDEEKEKLKQLEIIKNKKIPEEERLEALLTLTVSEEQKEIYRERYRKNRIEFNKNQRKIERLRQEIEEETISLD